MIRERLEPVEGFGWDDVEDGLKTAGRVTLAVGTGGASEVIIRAAEGIFGVDVSDWVWERAAAAVKKRLRDPNTWIVIGTAVASMNPVTIGPALAVIATQIGADEIEKIKADALKEARERGGAVVEAGVKRALSSAEGYINAKVSAALEREVLGILAKSADSRIGLAEGLATAVVAQAVESGAPLARLSAAAQVDPRPMLSRFLATRLNAAMSTGTFNVSAEIATAVRSIIESRIKSDLLRRMQAAPVLASYVDEMRALARGPFDWNALQAWIVARVVAGDSFDMATGYAASGWRQNRVGTAVAALRANEPKIPVLARWASRGGPGAEAAGARLLELLADPEIARRHVSERLDLALPRLEREGARFLAALAPKTAGERLAEGVDIKKGGVQIRNLDAARAQAQALGGGSVLPYVLGGLALAGGGVYLYKRSRR